MDKEILDLLYRSFDETLSADDMTRLQKALSVSSELRKEQERLRFMREKIKNLPDTSFGKGFAGKVMTALEKENVADKEEILLHILSRFVRPTAIAAAILLTGIITYNLSRADVVTWETVLGLHQTSLEEVFDPAQYLAVEGEQ